MLAHDAREHGVRTVFCSAQSDDVARVYEAVGFRRVGTSCIASMEPSSPD
jgi:N-acetylglutamate synthase-like GNAT family acetyltransferase